MVQEHPTIERIQSSMKEVQKQAADKGVSPVVYVQTKPAYEPTNQEEYIQSLAEYGIESDIDSSDTLSWEVELSDIQETLKEYPSKEQTKETSKQRLISDSDRKLLGQILQKNSPQSVNREHTHPSKRKQTDGPELG